MKQTYTVHIVTENSIGLLNHVTIVFTRRKLNIRSLTASESIIPNMYSYTIVLDIERDLVDKVAGQLEKIIGVSKVFVYEEEDIIHQELAMYKLPVSVISAGLHLEDIVRKHNARILSVDKEYILLEKTGHKAETQELLDFLQPYGVLQFSRSGRVAIAKPMKPLQVHLQERSDSFDYQQPEY